MVSSASAASSLRQLRAGLSLCLAFAGLAPGVTSAQDDPPTGPHAERFIREARVVAMRSVGSGSTRSRLALLRLSRETRRAIWKTVGSDDPYARNQEGDSYRHEVAAFEIDALLELGRVPATAARRVGERTGSMQLWLEGAEAVDREDPKALAPEAGRQLADIRLLRALIGAAPDSDLLLARGGDLYTIDHASAFRPDVPSGADRLPRVSRPAFEALKAADRALLEKRVRRWLSDDELAGLLRRRAELLEVVERRRQSSGDASVFLP